MSDRYITIPPDAAFIDPVTNEQIMVGPGVKMEDRPFEWFLHVYILSHKVFSMEVGGYDAVKAMKQIGKAMDKESDEKAGFIMVTDEQYHLMKTTMSSLASKDANDEKKVAKSSRGMTRQMTNFEAGCFIDHMDAIMNASTNKPELATPADTVEVVPVAPEPQVEAQAGAN